MITASDVHEYQLKKENVKTIGDFKELGREFRDKFNLTDREAIDLLNNKNVVEILSRHE